MFTRLAAVVLLLAPGATLQAQEGVPQGVSALSCIVVAVNPNVLEVALDDQKVPGASNKTVKIQVTKDTLLEQLDVQVTDGKTALSTKRITLKDLHREQPIGAIVYSDGKQLTLLRAVASGAGLTGKDLITLVEKLGGKAKRRTWEAEGKLLYNVDLKGTKVTDEDLRLLGPMKGMSDLDLSFTGVTDKGIAHLAGADDLRSLELIGTKVTDAAVPHLRRLRSLKWLICPQTAVTDKGVAELVAGRDLIVCRVGLGDKAHYRVYQRYLMGEARYNYLMIGDTYFGSYLGEKMLDTPDARPSDRRREATTYYHRHGPVGQVLAKLESFTPASVLHYPSDVRLPASLVGLTAPFGTLPASALVGMPSEPAVGVVRLNAGTHAAYGRPFQHVHFYDSTPEIQAFSLPAEGRPAYFGYIQDALKRGCNVVMFNGAERKTLAGKGPKRFYSALFVESARNDLRDIMTEFMTKEALAELMDSLTETGVLCFHTSHRYHDLTKPLIDAAKALNLAWKLGKDMGDDSRDTRTHFGSEWVVIARKAEHLEHLTNVKEDNRQLTWSVPASTGKHLWRDAQPPDLKALARPPLK